MTVKIRDATVGDADAISRVHIGEWQTQYAGAAPADEVSDLGYDKSAARWRAIIASRAETKRHFVVAERDGRVVGFAGCGPERDGNATYTGEVYVVYVYGGEQRGGAGRALFEAASERLRVEGHARMLAWILDTNPARAFYEKLGGRPVATGPWDGGSATAYGFDL